MWNKRKSTAIFVSEGPFATIIHYYPLIHCVNFSLPFRWIKAVRLRDQKMTWGKALRHDTVPAFQNICRSSGNMKAGINTTEEEGTWWMTLNSTSSRIFNSTQCDICLANSETREWNDALLDRYFLLNHNALCGAKGKSNGNCRLFYRSTRTLSSSHPCNPPSPSSQMALSSNCLKNS